jgi:hypothetical protein
VKRKVVILCAVVVCISLFLTGGKPKLISEDEAKKAGLAFINHVFDVNETEAVVSQAVQSGATYVDGEYQLTGDEQQIYFYSVAAPKLQEGQPEYVAYVNAETGVAYYAEQRYSHVPKMTVEQHEKWSKAYANSDSDAIDYLSMDVDCKDFAREWIPQKFDLKAKILGMVDSGSLFDQDGASTNFYIVIRDGTIYHITMAWPQLTVVEITILNQTRPTGDLP